MLMFNMDKLSLISNFCSVVSRGLMWARIGGSSTSAAVIAPGGSPRRWDGTRTWFVYFCSPLSTFVYLCYLSLTSYALVNLF